MTREEREEALVYFKNNAIRIKGIMAEESEVLEYRYMFSQYLKLTETAIEALEQEPCDDCVSRKAALEKAKSYNTDGWDMYTPLVVDVEDIEELPQVTPMIPKMRWIDHSDEGYVECPKCGSATNCDDNITDLHFCFSCGAEMEGGE